MQEDPYENNEFLNELRKDMNNIAVLQFRNTINNKFVKPIISLLTYLQEYCKKSSKTIKCLIQVVNYMYNDINKLKQEVKKLRERT